MVTASWQQGTPEPFTKSGLHFIRVRTRLTSEMNLTINEGYFITWIKNGKDCEASASYFASKIVRTLEFHFPPMIKLILKFQKREKNIW